MSIEWVQSEFHHVAALTGRGSRLGVCPVLVLMDIRERISAMVRVDNNPRNLTDVCVFVFNSNPPLYNVNL